MDERTRVMAKMRTGVDVESVRRRRTVSIALLSALGGITIAMLANRAQAKGATQEAVGGPLTNANLSMEGFDQQEIQRILAVQSYVDRWAVARGLDPDFVNGVIWVESRFRPNALSKVGAQGLMQVMPGTQQGYEAQTGTSGDAFDPEHSIFLGTYGLRKYLDYWGGNIPRTLASYNWGIGNVKSSPDSYPSVTHSYINSVVAARDRFSRARARGG